MGNREQNGDRGPGEKGGERELNARSGFRGGRNELPA